MRTRVATWAAGLLLLLLAAGFIVFQLSHRGEEAAPGPEPVFASTPQQVQRGAYLALAGNCAGCHTARGSAPYAGGQGIDTPFGMVYAGNLTPDQGTGLGAWSATDFWRALHHGRARDGRALYPVFPYPNMTLVTREDSDALYAYLQSLPAVRQARPEHTLRFPYNTQAALAVWRALYFAPGSYQAEAARSADWNRGAYLVRGLGHCNACHASRNLLGATGGPLEFDGGLIPMQGWYAPSLNSPAEAGVAHWSVQQVVDLLKAGVSAQASTLGPMAEVVLRSTQHLADADLQAMATFLRDLPQTTGPSPANEPRRTADDRSNLLNGKKIYDQRCADCHGAQGQGARPEGASAQGPLAYPALAGNRAVTMAASTNLVRIVRSGGFPPATAGNPRPYSMPPFDLSPDDTAAVVSYIRNAWGNQAAPITAAEVVSGK